MKFSSNLIVVCSMLVLAACSSDNDNPQPTLPIEPPAATLKVQVLHGSPDAPAVNVLVDGAEALSGVDYKVVGSEQLTLDEGTYSVQVDGSGFYSILQVAKCPLQTRPA